MKIFDAVCSVLPLVFCGIVVYWISRAMKALEEYRKCLDDLRDALDRRQELLDKKEIILKRLL